MSDKCERCKRGYAGALPREEIDWLDGAREASPVTARELRLARCARCSSYLLDLCAPAADRPGGESHDVCVVRHEVARHALLDRDPAALAAVSPQVRRRHLEELVARLPLDDRALLERIERGALEATEPLRGLVTRRLALASDLPPIGDVRPRARPPRATAAAVGLRVPLDLGDGSRVVLEAHQGGVALARMRGDAVSWRVALPGAAREAFVARVQGRTPTELVVLAAASPGEATGELFLARGSDGALRGPSVHGLRVGAFEAHALPGACTFVAGYQAAAVVRDDASLAWKGSSTGLPVAVPIDEGVVVVDAPWRLVALELPSGAERWTIPVDKGATTAPSGDGHLLLATSDVAARLDVRGSAPRLVWAASGASALPLAGGGAALVRERWEKSGRVVECVVVDASGRRRFAVGRPEATKTPAAELGNGVILYHSGTDVAVSAGERVVYTLAVPLGGTAIVTVEDGGAWVEYDGVIDRIDHTGQRVGRWRVG